MPESYAFERSKDMRKKKVTSSDIAHAAGVSQATVSMILNKKYNVSYIFVSDVETGEFQINFEGLGQIAEKVYDAQNVVIYKCNEL